MEIALSALTGSAPSVCDVYLWFYALAVAARRKSFTWYRNQKWMSVFSKFMLDFGFFTLNKQCVPLIKQDRNISFLGNMRSY